MAEALDQRQRDQDDPRESAQDEPDRRGIGSVADEAQPATQPVQRSPEQGEIREAFALFHGSRHRRKVYSLMILLNLA
jgi:hypothetical protein